MTHLSNSVTASIYKVEQEYPTNELRFFVYNSLVKTVPCDSRKTNDELLEIMIEYGREWQERNREGDNYEL